MKGFLQRIWQDFMKKNDTWNIRLLVDDLFIPSSKQPSVIYCRLTDFRSQWRPPIKQTFQPNMADKASPDITYHLMYLLITLTWIRSNLSANHSQIRYWIFFLKSASLTVMRWESFGSFLPHKVLQFDSRNTATPTSWWLN